MTVFRQEPQIAFNMVHEMAHRLARTNRLTPAFSADDHLALEPWYRFKHPANEARPDLHVTQEELGDCLGFDVHTVRESLRNLEAEGVVVRPIPGDGENTKKRGGVWVIEPARLDEHIESMV